MQNLKKSFPQKQQIQLTFFASWCQSCKDHLLKAEALVGTFDEPDRIEQVISNLHLQQPCFIDQGWARELGIEGLPAQMEIELYRNP